MKIVLNLQSLWKGLGDFQGPLGRLAELLPYTALWVLALDDTESQINCRQSFLLRLKSTLYQKNAVSKRSTTGLKPKCQCRSGRHRKRRKYARLQTTRWGLWCPGQSISRAAAAPQTWQIIPCRNAGWGWFLLFKRNQKLGLFFFSLET